MKKYIIFIISILCSCGIDEIDTGRRPSTNDAWKNPSVNIDSSANARKVCYVTGLDYPKDYDWRADSENGSVKCSLVVFADGVPAMKLAVGHEYQVSPDPDMHRVIKGNLYTDYSSGNETIIKRDGKEIFRYSGREMILGMAVSDSNIFTLGQDRRGGGFCYRKNGESILRRENGRAFPRLQAIGDSLYFAFCEHIESSEGSIERYYISINGKSRQVAVREDITKVWDIIWHDGKVSYLAEMTGVKTPVLVMDENMRAMDMSKEMKIISARLIPAGKSIFIEAIYSYMGMYWASGLWKDGAKYKTFSRGQTVSGICSEDEGICCILSSSLGSEGGSIFRCGDSFSIPAGYRSIGCNPIAMKDGILHVGLSPSKGGKPLIWKEGQTYELDINGCICSVTVQ